MNRDSQIQQYDIFCGGHWRVYQDKSVRMQLPKGLDLLKKPTFTPKLFRALVKWTKFCFGSPFYFRIFRLSELRFWMFSRPVQLGSLSPLFGQKAP